MSEETIDPALKKQREYGKKAYWKNHERTLELSRARAAKSRAADREGYNRRQREYNQRNKDHINAKRRERLRTDPEYAEKVRLADRKRHAKNGEVRRDNRLKLVYNLSLNAYLSMYEAQEGKCWICKETKPPKGKNGLVVDHCHAEGHVRGLLCPQCNQGLGKFKDDIQRLQKAIEYLKEQSWQIR